MIVRAPASTNSSRGRPFRTRARIIPATPTQNAATIIAVASIWRRSPVGTSPVVPSRNKTKIADNGNGVTTIAAFPRPLRHAGRAFRKFLCHPLNAITVKLGIAATIRTCPRKSTGVSAHETKSAMGEDTTGAVQTGVTGASCLRRLLSSHNLDFFAADLTARSPQTDPLLSSQAV